MFIHLATYDQEMLRPGYQTPEQRELRHEQLRHLHEALLAQAEDEQS